MAFSITINSMNTYNIYYYYFIIIIIIDNSIILNMLGLCLSSCVVFYGRYYGSYNVLDKGQVR